MIDRVSAWAIRPDSFTRKQIIIEFHVKNPDSTTDHLLLDGTHAVRATVSNGGLIGSSTLNLSVWGLTLTEVNRLSWIAGYTTNTDPQTVNLSATKIIVRAGKYGHDLPAIFSGTILEAFMDFNASPDPVFQVTANAVTEIAKTSPVSLQYEGSWEPSAMLHDLCTRNECNYVDHGGWGNARIHGQLLKGSLLDQFKTITQAVRGSFKYEPTIDGVTQLGTLHAYGSAYGKDLDDRNTPLVSRKTGMIGYPRYNASGCSFSTLFRTDLSYNVPCKIESDYTPSAWANVPTASQAPWNGLWLANLITHDISAEIKGGPWLTQVECTRADIKGNLVNAPRT